MSFLPMVPGIAREFEIYGGRFFSIEKEVLVIGGYKEYSIAGATILAGGSQTINLDPPAKGVIVLVDGVRTASVGSQAQIQVEIIGADKDDNPTVLVTAANGNTSTIGCVASSPDYSITQVVLSNPGTIDVTFSAGTVRTITKRGGSFAMYHKSIGLPYREMPYLVLRADVPRLLPGTAFWGMALAKINPLGVGATDPRVIANFHGTMFARHAIGGESHIADPLLEYLPVIGAQSASGATASNFNNTRGIPADGRSFFYAYSTQDIDRIASVITQYAVLYQNVRPGSSIIEPPRELVKDLFLFMDRRGTTQFDVWLVPPEGLRVRHIRTWSDQTHEVRVYGAWNEGADGVGTWNKEYYAATNIAANTITEIVPSEYFNLHRTLVINSVAGRAIVIAYMRANN